MSELVLSAMAGEPSALGGVCHRERMDRAGRRERELADESAAVRRRFHEVGYDVIEAVPAFSGLYPYYNGLGNWELFFTSWRVLARTDAGLEAWSAWSGPTPRKQLLVCPSDQFAVVSMDRRLLGRRRYDRVALASHKFWVHRRYRDVVRGWAGIG